MAARIPKQNKSLSLPRLVEAEPQENESRWSSLEVNIDVVDYLKSHLVTKYENWLYPGLSQTRFDGFDSCCRSSAGQSSISSTSKSLCKRIPNTQELITLFFAPDITSILNWEKSIVAGKNLHVANVQDELIQSQVLRIMGKADGSVCISTPKILSESLGITLPYLNMIIRNLDCYFSFEIQILDNMGIKRLFTMSNFKSLVRVTNESCSMPMRLDVGWNQVILDLPSFVNDAFGTRYRETIRMKLNANIYVRRIYFSSDLFDETTLPAEYKIFPLGDLDKSPIYRKRNDMDEEEFALTDIVLPKLQSVDDLMNKLFDSASGYIQIDEENWDKPRLVIKEDPGLKFPNDLKDHSLKSIDISESVDSLKVFSSLEARNRRIEFVHGEDSLGKSFADIPPNADNGIREASRHSTPTVADLLENLSEIYEFLATLSNELIPKASSETLDDLASISESLKDMASFSGVFQNMLTHSQNKLHDPSDQAAAAEKTDDHQKKKPKSLAEDISTALSDEEIIISLPGYQQIHVDGIPVHVTPHSVLHGAEPSMLVLNVDVSRQVLAHMEKRKFLENQSSEFTDVYAKVDTDSLSVTSNFNIATVKESTSCMDFALKSHMSSVKSLKDFASLSSDLVHELSSIPRFIKSFAQRSSVKSRISDQEILIHMRKLSIALKQVESVSSLEAIRLTQLEKTNIPAEDQLPLYNVFEKYNESQTPKYTGSIELFNTQSIDCCVVKRDPPFLVKHSGSDADIDTKQKISGMSLFDSTMSLSHEKTSLDSETRPLPRTSRISDGISTKVIKIIKNLSSEITKNFSTQSVQILTESTTMMNQKLGTDSQLLLAGFEGEIKSKVCPKYINQIRANKDPDLSQVSLKYQPSSSSVNVFPDFKPGSIDGLSEYNVFLKMTENDGAPAWEKIEPFLNYDAIPCESWQDFFVPGNGKDCDLNIGSMSAIWNKFGKVPDNYAVGFDMASSFGSSPLASGRSKDAPESAICSESISGETIYSNTSSEAQCTNVTHHRHSHGGKAKHRTQIFTGSRQRMLGRSSDGSVTAIAKTPFSLPASKSVSSSSSHPQSLVASAVSSEGIISLNEPKFKNTCATFPEESFRVMSEKSRRKVQQWNIGNKSKKSMAGLVNEASTSTSLSSMSDSDSSEKHISLKVLKKMCRDILKKSPAEVLASSGVGISIIPSDHGLWSPIDHSSDSEDFEHSSDDPGKSPESRIGNIDTSEDDVCLNSADIMASRQTLVMVSSLCSAETVVSGGAGQRYESSEFFSHPSYSSEGDTDTGQVYFWNKKPVRPITHSPSLTSSSRYSSPSSLDDDKHKKETSKQLAGPGNGPPANNKIEFKEVRQSERPSSKNSGKEKTDFTTILAPDLKEVNLFNVGKERKITLSKRSAFGLTHSTNLLLQNLANKNNPSKYGGKGSVSKISKTKAQSKTK